MSFEYKWMSQGVKAVDITEQPPAVVTICNSPYLFNNVFVVNTRSERGVAQPTNCSFLRKAEKEPAHD